MQYDETLRDTENDIRELLSREFANIQSAYYFAENDNQTDCITVKITRGDIKITAYITRDMQIHGG